MDVFKWSYMGSLHKNIQLMLEFFKAPFLVQHFSYYTLTLFRMGLFEAAHGWRRGGGKKTPPLPIISYAYPTMMKVGTVIPYLKKIQKIYKSLDTPLSSADISIFSPEINNTCCIKKYRYRLHFNA